jgi:hypothetical protein
VAPALCVVVGEDDVHDRGGRRFRPPQGEPCGGIRECFRLATFLSPRRAGHRHLDREHTASAHFFASRSRFS